jgi:hypothetical protein
MLANLLRVMIELGLPVAALSWLLFYRLYSRGELARDADHKAIRSSLKQVKKTTRESGSRAEHPLHAKWMRFGGGFYGIAALWTLIVIEVGGVLGTISHPSSIEQMFRGGPVDFIVHQLVNQVTTFVQAIMWITWWPEEHGRFGWMAIVIAYAGYLAGLNLARRETALGSRLIGWGWRAQVQSWLGKDKDA